MGQRVYLINLEEIDSDDFNKLSDDEFIDIAERQRTVWSIKGFQDEFNSYGNINSAISAIRIIEVN